MNLLTETEINKYLKNVDALNQLRAIQLNNKNWGCARNIKKKIEELGLEYLNLLNQPSSSSSS